MQLTLATTIMSLRPDNKLDVDEKTTINNTVNVFPTKTLIFKDINESDHGTDNNLHESESTTDSRIKEQI